MGYSFFFINHTKKQIVHTEPYDILRSLNEYFVKYDWEKTDTIDLLREDDTDVKELVKEEGYTIDHVCWWE
jgi:hypothetical protein